MYRPSRMRRTLKWTGISVCALLLAAWGVSIVRATSWAGPALQLSQMRGDVVGGYLVVDWPAYAQPTWPVSPFENYYVLADLVQSHGFGWPVIRPHRGLTGYVQIPLWCLLLLTGLPTAICIHKDHQRCFRVGHCSRCGYDLTG